jgi:hypothetical protein
MVRQVTGAALRAQALVGFVLWGACALVGCSTEETSDAAADTAVGGDSDSGGSGALPDGIGVDTDDDATPPADVTPEPTACPDGLAFREWEEGSGGPHRHDLAADFTITTVQGREFSLRENWNGCEVYVFIPDQIPNTSADRTSIWARDVDNLIAASPDNVHYFFVSTLPREASAQTAVREMAQRVEEAVDALPVEEQDAWFDRIHVVDTAAPALTSWLKETFAGAGRQGWLIDREQRIRGVGSFADVTRYNQDLANAEAWPWESNLANAAADAAYINAEARRDAELAAQERTVVSLWQGEILAGFADTETTLPSAEEIATYNILEIEVEQLCPDRTIPEFGNCGPWDYLAYLWLWDGDTRLELGRFITTYHREGRFIVDASPMLPLLAEGGLQRFQWEFAPEWNTQPTSTHVRLRFGRSGATDRPSELVPLWTGGTFNPEYNDIQADKEIEIPADVTRVELWAIITGHGAELQNCAEFCNHEHEVRINGDVYFRDHPIVGDDQGCIAELENGMTPNQWGTWWFGRGGWCPGQRVEPWQVDVTESVTAGETADLTYVGTLNGRTPSAAAGTIRMTSYLVFYR